jgi:hypothetical protein
MLSIPTAAHDTPQQHISNIPRNLLREGVEAVSARADIADVSVGREGEDVLALDLL